MLIDLNKAFKDIVYVDEGHYYFHLQNRTKLKPTTTFIQQWIEPFDEDHWLPIKAEDFRTSPKKLKSWWKYKSDIALAGGSLLHDYLENLFRRKYFSPKYPEFIDKEVMDKLLALGLQYYKMVKEPVVALEFVMGNENIGGQSDQLLQGTEGLTIRDYKTGELKPQYKNKTLKAPYDFVPDSSLGKYSLQLNTYRQLLENKGFKVEKLEIVHFNEDNDQPYIYPLEKFDITL